MLLDSYVVIIGVWVVYIVSWYRLWCVHKMVPSLIWYIGHSLSNIVQGVDVLRVLDVGHMRDSISINLNFR